MDVLQLALGRKLTKLIQELRRDDSDSRARPAQQINFAGSDPPATDDHDGSLVELKKNGQVIHARAGASQACAAT